MDSMRPTHATCWKCNTTVVVAEAVEQTVPYKGSTIFHDSMTIYAHKECPKELSTGMKLQ